METLLKGIPHVTVYIDDIVISGENDADHLQNLETVLECLAKAGLRAKKNNCVTSVDYIGNVIDAQGLHPRPYKVLAIQQAHTPLNVTQMKAHLGLLSYYRNFSLICPLC